MTKNEALQMCLEYIETDAHERKYVRHAIKDALGQPEQERKWVGLTYEEIESAISDGFARGLDNGNISNQTVINYVRGIEAKLKELNNG